MICLSKLACVLFDHSFVSWYQRLLSSLIEVFHLLRDVQIVSFFHEMNMLSLVLPWDEYVVSSGVVYISIVQSFQYITLLLFIIWPEKCPALCSSFASERVRLQASVRLPSPNGLRGEVFQLFLSTCNVSNDLIFAYFCFCLWPPNLALTIVFLMSQ